MTHSVISHSPDETCEIARDLIQQLPCRAVIALHGELGSGKTCFVQGLALALEINQPVTSPTFTIVNEYTGSRSLFHIDLYRMNSPDEILAFGFEDYLEADGITAIEWAERAGSLIPGNATHIYFETMPDPSRRSIEIRTTGSSD